MILHKNPDYALYGINIGRDAQNLLKSIFLKDPKKRIKISEMKKHIFFKDMDFDKMIKYQIKAPFVPDIVII